jgi:hemerythrin-like domain-containing protein
MTHTADSTARYPLIEVEIPSSVNFQDHAATFAIEMSLIHNVIIRGLNSLYTKAPCVTETDTVDFAGYALAWIHLVHAHHHGEEAILFPFFKTKFDMDHNVSQHKEFIEPMKAFEDYMIEVQKKQSTFDGQRAREMIESFGEVLLTHLHEEVNMGA